MPIPDAILRMVRRMRYPEAAAKADSLVEDGLGFARGAGDAIAPLGAGDTPHTWLRKGEELTLPIYKRLMNDVHSPEFVLGREDAGKKIIESATHWDLEGNRVVAPITEQYLAAAKRVAKGSDLDRQVFQALENPLIAEKLPAEGRALYDFMKTQYDLTGKMRIRHLAGDEETFSKILRMSEREVTEPEMVGWTADQVAALRFAKAKKTDYAPHVFSKEALIERFTRKREELVTELAQTKSPRKRDFLQGNLEDYEDKLKKMVEQGGPLTWDTLPKEFRFKHQMVRRGVDEYVQSARQSFESYIMNFKRSMFDDPAVKEMAAHYSNLSPALMPYAKWFIREYAGYNNKDAWDKVAGGIASFQYMRTLGGNLRSPIMNLTQQVNTLVDAGPSASIRGYVNLFNPKVKDLWTKSGLAGEIPQALGAEIGSLQTSPFLQSFEKTKRILGYFFNKAEEFNRKHAFSTYLTRALDKGLDEGAAMKAAIDGVHKAQFQYGRVGMPKVLRTPAGRVFGQFTSFSIKQAEFLWKLGKENPAKLLTYVGGTAGTNMAVENYLGLDLSNALGFPVNLGEAIESLRSMSRAEFEEAYAHGKLAFSGGTGILPTSLGGPTYGSIRDLQEAMGRGASVAPAFVNMVQPVQWKRVATLYQSLTQRIEGSDKYPMMKDPLTHNQWSKEGKERLYETSLGKVVAEATVARTTEHSEKTSAWYKQQVMDQLDSKRKRVIAEAIASGNGKRAERLIQKYKLVPTLDTVANALAMRLLPREARKTWRDREMRQRVREQMGLSEKGEEE